MSRHLSEEQLLRFVEGDLDEALAVELALHIDACPLCAARATQADPLAHAFAAMPVPLLPEGFERAVLEVAAEPAFDRAGLHVPWLGVALILCAGLLMMLGGEPTALLWKLAAAARGIGIAAVVLLGLLPSPAIVLTAFAAIALGGSLTTFRLLGLSRESA
jgi:anti-sigma factor RsiW